jgi:hypothetical protein
MEQLLDAAAKFKVRPDLHVAKAAKCIAKPGIFYQTGSMGM